MIKRVDKYFVWVYIRIVQRERMKPTNAEEMPYGEKNYERAT